MRSSVKRHSDLSNKQTHCVNSKRKPAVVKKPKLLSYSSNSIRRTWLTYRRNAPTTGIRDQLVRHTNAITLEYLVRGREETDDVLNGNDQGRGV